MSDWNCQVLRIEKIEKHEGADRLSVATVSGYPVVFQTGQYQVSDLVGYIAIDTVVPDTEQFYFLCPKAYEKYEEDGEIKQRQLGPKYVLGSVPEKYRIIKSKRILGKYSQGMLVACPEGLKEGDNLVPILGLKKWEEEEEDNLPLVKGLGTNAEKAPPSWQIPYYDIENVRKYLSCVENEQDVLLTEKLHGCNAGFCHDGSRLWVKSRNYYKRRDEDDMWWDAALRYDLENKLAKFPMLVFFAELIGNVKGFRYGAEIVDGKLQTELYFFDIYDTVKKRYLDYDDFAAICLEAGLDTTPLLYRGPFLSKEKMYAMAERKTELGGKHIAEGWVLSLGKERYEPRLDSRLKLKYISEGYNLAK